MSGPSRRVVVGSMAAVVIAPAMAARAAHEDAMWVWGNRIAASDVKLPGFARHQGIGTLLVYIGPGEAESLLSGRREAAEALALLTSGGARVFAVAGEPDWAARSSVLPEHAALIARLPKHCPRVAGVHFDVEPHALPEWADARARATLADGLVRFYASVREAAPSATVDAAVNPVYAHIPAGSGTLLGAIARCVDSIAIMAYRSSPARAAAWAAPAASLAAAAGRKWRIGVLSGDGEPGTSWRGASPNGFERGMAALRYLAAGGKGGGAFLGLAHQDYDSLFQLLSE